MTTMFLVISMMRKKEVNGSHQRISINIFLGVKQYLLREMRRI